MHIVNLAHDWFDPNGTYRAKRDNPHEVPEFLFDHIPSSAIVDGAKKGEKVAKKDAEKLVKGDKEELAARAEADKLVGEAKAERSDRNNIAVRSKL